MFRTTRPTSAFHDDDPQRQGRFDDSDSNNRASILNCRQQAKLSRHHPGVKLPPRLEDKSKTEQIERSCDRFKSHSRAVDTLYKTLSTIKSNPYERRFRIINKTNPGFIRSVANIPGTEQLLKSVNFVENNNNVGGRQSNNQLLVLNKLDLKLLQIALTCLEDVKQTKEYKQSKKQIEFEREMKSFAADDPADESELMERKKLLSQVPKEPTQGRGALVTIMIPIDNTSNNSNTTTNSNKTQRDRSKDTVVLQRRFDGDDTLQDVLNWFGGNMGTIFLNNIMDTRRWSLVDINRYPRDIPIDCSDKLKNEQQTLQYLGFWPSGRLILRPSSVEWMDRSSSMVKKNVLDVSPVGLGSAL